MINNKDDAFPSPLHFLNRKATFLFSPILNPEWGKSSGVISASENIGRLCVEEIHKTTESIRLLLLKFGVYFMPMGTFGGKGLR